MSVTLQNIAYYYLRPSIPQNGWLVMAQSLKDQNDDRVREFVRPGLDLNKQPYLHGAGTPPLYYPPLKITHNLDSK